MLTCCTILSTTQLYRHGARSPIWIYPTDPYKDHWKDGTGRLTQVYSSELIKQLTFTIIWCKSINGIKKLVKNLPETWINLFRSYVLFDAPVSLDCRQFFYSVWKKDLLEDDMSLVFYGWDLEFFFFFSRFCFKILKMIFRCLFPIGVD